MEKNEATGLQKITLGIAIFSLLVNLLNLNSMRIEYPNYFSKDYKYFGEDIAGLQVVFYLVPGIFITLSLMIACLAQRGLKPIKVMIPIILLPIAHCSLFLIIYFSKTYF